MTKLLLLQTVVASPVVADASVSVVSPTAGVVVLNARVPGAITPAPLHWRAGDWTKPPLDIYLAPDGRLELVEVVFQDEALELVNRPAPVPEEIGLPLFDATGWPDDRYRDVRVDLRITRLPTDHIVIEAGHLPPSRWIRVTSVLAMGLSADLRLAEIMIGPLSAHQLGEIEVAASDGGRSGQA